ncbi:MAG TPA: Stf0 family sulfotransferase [Ktedonobacteraceae bacterium]|nr:Stf0 family sulfotransferase [Ktedonobacteraceae bacterium]
MPKPNTSYLICATPRSGSTLLCEALDNTGLAGHPKEYFEALKKTGLPRRPREYFENVENTAILQLLGNYSRLDDEYGQPTFWDGPGYAQYLAHVLEEGTTPNGVFGAKMMWGYFGDFIENARQIPAYRYMAVPDILNAIFPDLHYIWVTRRDKARQAVSLWKAIQTWTWKHDWHDALAGMHNHKELVFNFEAIDHLVQRINAHDEAWQRYFTECGVRPYTVIYEELAGAYEETALSILRYLHIPIGEPVVFGERRMRRQADGLSEEWVQRYYALKRVDSVV